MCIHLFPLRSIFCLVCSPMVAGNFKLADWWSFNSIFDICEDLTYTLGIPEVVADIRATGDASINDNHANSEPN